MAKTARAMMTGLVAVGGVFGLGACAAGSTASAPTPLRAPANASPGCTSTPVSPIQVTIPLSAAGDTGSYIRQLPSDYNGRKPLPTVIDLHGYAEPASLQVTVSNLGQYGDDHGFITITPEVNHTVPMWNTTLGGPDLRFFASTLDAVEHSLCVDENRVFVTGYSDGAFMTSAIACQYADRVAAVAPVAGIQSIAGCRAARPVPVVAFHGTADPFVSYTGGLGASALRLPAPDGSGRTIGQLANPNDLQKGPSIPAITARWAHRNRCQSPPAAVKVANDVTLVQFRCPPQGSVELYRIAGGGHAWPGSNGSNAIAAVVGRTTFSISADAVMWAFFRAHPLQPHP